MQRIGHGNSSPMTSEKALAIARDTPIAVTPEISTDAWPALELHTEVTVTPQDYGAVPVAGQLVRLTQDEVAIRREDELAGEVVVHFPRIGYCVEASA